MNKHKIEILVEELDPKSLFMSIHLGQGSTGKTDFEIAQTTGGNPFVEITDGKVKTKYLVNLKDLVTAIVNFHLEKKPVKVSK